MNDTNTTIVDKPHIFDIEVVNQFADKQWRLSNLYWILDENNREVKFVPNVMQRRFWDEMWYLNLILKARQHGATTFIDLFILDDCVFIPNQIAGIIAHTIDDVKKIFRRKIKHPYDRLPAEIRDANPASNDSAQELVFGNKSEISVGTTMRAGTLSYLHVSEFGYIAARTPDKADEIVTGSFNTVHPGSFVFVESTGYGKSGHFYDMCQRTKARKLTGVPLSKMDFKYHFYAWWENPKYTLPDDDAKHVVFTRQHNEYFRRIERSEGITLTLGQRAWYIKKKELNGDLQGREYPSNDREPFEVAVRGSIFAEDMMKLRESGRITKVPHDPALMVDTWWDLGRGAKNAIWFVQQLGMEYRLIHYHEEELRSLQYWCGKFLPELAKERGFKYRHHCAPHDIESTDMTSARDKTRWQIASELGVTFIPGKQWDQGDQIEAGHSLLPLCWIDEENCSEGITHLELFRFEWNENLQTYMDARYRHDAHSHGCSALMTGAMLQGDLHTQRPRAQPVGRRSYPT